MERAPEERRVTRPKAARKLPADHRMNHLLTNFVGWLASVLLIVTATVLWGVAAVFVWIGGGPVSARN